MDKKAAIGMLVTIIVTLASFIAIIGFYFSVQKNIGDTYLEACHAIMGAKKIESQLIGDNLHLIDQNCLTTQFEVEADRFENPRQVSKYFADKMALAWWVVHEGTIPEMWDEENDYLFSGSWFDQEECVILETIDYQGNPGDAPIVNASFFGDFLLEEVYLENHLGTSWKYQDYFQSYGQHVTGKAASRGLVSFAPANLEFIPGKTYAIGVGSVSEGNFVGSATTGAIVAVAAGVLLAPLTGGLSLGLVAGATVVGGVTAGSVDYLSDIKAEKPRPTLIMIGEYEAMQLAGCVAQTQLE